jgi:single-stranded-DNA-specific exonuclease
VSEAGKIPHPEHRWIQPDAPARDDVALLARELHLPHALCALLVTRGVREVEAAKRHLRPLLAHLHPPELLAGAADAADRLLQAIARGETILVHGDYDVDGICGAALYTFWLRRLGARVVPFVPHRLRDGYDFSGAGLQRAAEAGATVILTADCGTVAHSWLAEARARGLDVIVTDHHTPGPTLPPALAVVNPARPDCPYPEKSLCGTGVAFKLCQLLAERSGIALDELLPHLDLVALATVADLVSLEGENRVLVRYTKPGLRALLEVTGMAGREVEAGKVGFVLAPRINAAGRMADAAEGLKLLLTEDEGEANVLAKRLDDVNRDRQQEDRRTLTEALALLSERFEPDRDYGVVLAADGWHPGVIGIVASRVVERIHRPVILIALDGERGRGSGRSIPGFHLHDAISACSSHLVRFGGHRQAAGLDVRREDLPAFQEAFEREAKRRLEGVELRPTIRIDLEISPREATLSLLERLRYLGPHGMGNPRPVFIGRGLTLDRPAKVVGSGHLRLRLRGDGRRLEGIGFRMAERLSPDELGQGPLDVVFTLQADEYRGEVRVQARFLDVRPSVVPSASKDPVSTSTELAGSNTAASLPASPVATVSARLDGPFEQSMLDLTEVPAPTLSASSSA